MNVLHNGEYILFKRHEQKAFLFRKNSLLPFDTQTFLQLKTDHQIVFLHEGRFLGEEIYQKVDKTSPPPKIHDAWRESLRSFKTDCDEMLVLANAPEPEQPTAADFENLRTYLNSLIDERNALKAEDPNHPMVLELATKIIATRKRLAEINAEVIQNFNCPFSIKRRHFNRSGRARTVNRRF